MSLEFIPFDPFFQVACYESATAHFFHRGGIVHLKACIAYNGDIPL